MGIVKIMNIGLVILAAGLISYFLVPSIFKYEKKFLNPKEIEFQPHNLVIAKRLTRNIILLGSVLTIVGLILQLVLK